jgi:methionyl-tRNA synthetase
MPISECSHDHYLHRSTFRSYSRLDAEISITLALNLVYLLSLVLQPFMPTTADEIRTQLNIKETVFALEDGFRCYLPAGHTIGQAQPLFKRIEKAQADDYRARFAGQKK